MLMLRNKIKNNAKKIIAFALCLATTVTMFAGCSGAAKRPADTLVVASTEFNGVFNSALYHSAYDFAIAGKIQSGIYGVDRNNNYVDEMCVYQAPEEFQQDGKTFVRYTFKIKEGMVFSDGEPVTADDIIFTYKVYLDPDYDGLSTMYSLPIVGFKEYWYDTNDYEALEKKYEEEAISKVDAAYMLQWLQDTYEISEEDAKPYVEDQDELAAAKEEYAKNALGEAIKAKLASGTAEVTEISGITKKDDLTVEVIANEVSPIVEGNLAVGILPEHYYGKDYSKGNLKAVKDLNGKPLGSGPYTFESFENNIVTLVANPKYYKGEPAIKHLVYQKTESSNMYSVVKRGDVDVADPSASKAQVEEAGKDKIDYSLILNNGYGYVGINAARVPDKNVRKALMHLMDRQPAVTAYYGDLADIIERPLSKVDWAYPQGATEYYGYSVDKAREYFEAAGYTKNADGKLVNAAGEQFAIELWLSQPDHPVAPMFTQMKTDLTELGARCDIQQVEWAVYNDKYTAGELDVWAAAYGNASDPDMYQIYHSNQIANNNNPFRVNNAELDKLIIEGRSVLDRNKRKEIYAKAYDVLMDEAVQMPFYQRYNMYAYNSNVLDIDSLPKDMTPYYEWDAEINTLRVKNSTGAVEEAK